MVSKSRSLKTAWPLPCYVEGTLPEEVSHHFVGYTVHREAHVGSKWSHFAISRHVAWESFKSHPKSFICKMGGKGWVKQMLSGLPEAS